MDRFGNTDNAYLFDGIGSYILVGDPVPAVLQVQNDNTLSAWIFATGYPSNELMLIVGSQNEDNKTGATLFLSGIENQDGQSSPVGHIHFQIGDGAWHHTNVNAQIPINRLLQRNTAKFK
jgi:hypothetical protein